MPECLSSRLVGARPQDAGVTFTVRAVFRLGLTVEVAAARNIRCSMGIMTYLVLLVKRSASPNTYINEMFCSKTCAWYLVKY